MQKSFDDFVPKEKRNDFCCVKTSCDEKRVGCDETSGSLLERICVYRKFDESVKVFTDYFILHPVRLRSLPHRYGL